MMPKTDARRCPGCQSDRIGPAEHVIVSGRIVVREEHRCAACGVVFWVRADGAPLKPPSDATGQGGP
jgi:predicted Zn-ribbon and HTH transcriptional regulator